MVSVLLFLFLHGKQNATACVCDQHCDNGYFVQKPKPQHSHQHNHLSSADQSNQTNNPDHFAFSAKYTEEPLQTTADLNIERLLCKDDNSGNVSDEAEEIAYCDVVDEEKDGDLPIEQLEQLDEEEPAEDGEQIDPLEWMLLGRKPTAGVFRLTDRFPILPTPPPVQPQLTAPLVCVENRQQKIPLPSMTERPTILMVSTGTPKRAATPVSHTPIPNDTDESIVDDDDPTPPSDEPRRKNGSLPNAITSNPSPVAALTAQLLQNPNDLNNDETYFVLSLIGTFKRLPPQKRAIAKCNILRYLTELEFGET